MIPSASAGAVPTPKGAHEQDERPFLNAEPARNGEGDAARRRRQALDDEGRPHDTGTPSSPRISQVSPTWASQPARCQAVARTQRAAAFDARRPAPDRRRPRRTPAGAQPPVSVKRQRARATVRRRAAPPPATPRRSRRLIAIASRSSSAQAPQRVRRRGDRQRGHPHQREQHLARRRHGHVGDHRGGRVGARNAAQRQQAGAREVAADLGHRQQGVDRFADPAQPQRGPPARPPAGGINKRQLTVFKAIGTTR